MAFPMGCVAPVTTQPKPYNLPSDRYGEKGEEESIGFAMVDEVRQKGVLGSTWHVKDQSPVTEESLAH